MSKFSIARDRNYTNQKFCITRQPPFSNLQFQREVEMKMLHILTLIANQNKKNKKIVSTTSLPTDTFSCIDGWHKSFYDVCRD